MDQGLAPEEIIDSLVENDVQRSPSLRQYGIVDLVDNGRSAGYTGSGATDYKNHLLGKTYAIQGNILLGQEILDSMEEGFLETQGILADKLMAALQGAKVPGADTRCLESNKSSVSAFIRMAKPDDQDENYYLDLNVDRTTGNDEPIDRLQELYDEWRGAVSPIIPNQQTWHADHIFLTNQPNPFYHTTVIHYRISYPCRVAIDIINTLGQTVATLLRKYQPVGVYHMPWEVTDSNGNHLPEGLYLCRLTAGSQVRTQAMLVLE